MEKGKLNLIISSEALEKLLSIVNLDETHK
jgi:hypothetical protein